MNRPATAPDPTLAAADVHNDARDHSYQSAVNNLPAYWLDCDLATSAIEGVELDREQAEAIAKLRDLAHITDHPALLQSAILNFCKTFDDLIVDYVCENCADPL